MNMNKERPEKAWYVISASSGYEKKVKENLENRIVNEGLEDEISTIFLPEQEVTLKSGKTKMKNMWPGYMYIEMRMTDENWFIVRNAQYVTGFLGSSGNGTKPFPASRRKIRQLIHDMAKKVAVSKGEPQEVVKVDFIPGDFVEIVEGVDKGYIGKVIDIHLNTKEVTIEKEFLGRNVPMKVLIANVIKTAA